MAGYNLAKFCFCMLMDKDTVKVPKLKKKAMIKILSTLKKNKRGQQLFFLFAFSQWESPRRPESPFLPTCVANHSTGFASSCQAWS